MKVKLEKWEQKWVGEWKTLSVPVKHVHVTFHHPPAAQTFGITCTYRKIHFFIDATIGYSQTLKLAWPECSTSALFARFPHFQLVSMEIRRVSQWFQTSFCLPDIEITPERCPVCIRRWLSSTGALPPAVQRGRSESGGCCCCCVWPLQACLWACSQPASSTNRVSSAQTVMEVRWGLWWCS